VPIKRHFKPTTNRRVGDDAVRSIKEAKNQLWNIVTTYNKRYDEEYQRYTKVHAHAHAIRPDMTDFGDMVVEINAKMELAPLCRCDMPKIIQALEFLSSDNSKAAVKAITVLFSSKCDEYRGKAIEHLAAMKTEHARKALARRASWLSMAPKKEKKTIKELLNNNGPAPKATIESILPLAEEGNDEAQYTLGKLYYEGQGLSPDYKSALKWFRLAAEQGFAKAQCDLGRMYEQGTGVTKDYEEARKWYCLAAEQQLPLAQTFLGAMYSSGSGVPQDKEKAVEYYQLAARQGFQLAQYYLGNMYRMGSGTLRDYVMAYVWFTLAGEQGNQIAEMDRNKIKANLGFLKQRRAHKLIKEYRTQYKC
jgi:TPR repeat protein